MNILALDLGKKTGYAYVKEGVLYSGTAEFGVKRGESHGMLYYHFRQWLCNMGAWAEPGLIAYELPHHRGGYATDVLVGFSTRVQEYAASHDIDYIGVHSATLKKSATGNGRASKADMVAAMQKRWGWDGEDDNESDALAILSYAIKEFSSEKEQPDE